MNPDKKIKTVKIAIPEKKKSKKEKKEEQPKDKRIVVIFSYDDLIVEL